MTFQEMYTRRKLYRRQDPDTSREAAQTLDLAKRMGIALGAVRLNEGSTAKELEETMGMTDGQIRKRLNDLRLAELVHKEEKRKCRVTGRWAYTWYSGTGEIQWRIQR